MRCESDLRADDTPMSRMLCRQDAAQSGGRTVTEDPCQLVGVSGNWPQRLSWCFRLADSHEGIDAQQRARETSDIKARGSIGVMMAQQKMNFTAQHDLLARLHTVGKQIECSDDI